MRRGGDQRRASAYDAELGLAVSRAQQGDEEAFATAYRLVHPGLLGYMRGLVGEDAEDVASDAWLEIARDLKRFRGMVLVFGVGRRPSRGIGRWTTFASRSAAPARH